MLARSLLVALLPLLASALPCVQFDYAMNLYAFGGEQDVNLGTNTSWASPSPKPLSTEGRPPWSGKNSQCLLSQNNNAMYVVGADDANPGDLYIYDFAGDKWSKMTTTGVPSPLSNSRSAAVLDHDTNVLFLLPGDGQQLYSLDMESITTTAAGTLAWQVASTPPWSTQGYKPAVASASNHIHFFGVPSTPAGSADIFVVHYNYFQPQPQAYPGVGGASFPTSAGQAISVPNSGSATPYQMMFIPDDFSNTYVVNHWVNDAGPNITANNPMPANLLNTTQVLPAPSSKDANAAYAASDTAVVQIDTQGNIYYITGAVQAWTVKSGASWQKMSYQLKPYVAPTTTAAASGGASQTGNKGQASAAATSGAAAASGGAKSGALSATHNGAYGLASVVAALAGAVVLL